MRSSEQPTVFGNTAVRLCRLICGGAPPRRGLMNEEAASGGAKPRLTSGGEAASTDVAWTDAQRAD